MAEIGLLWLTLQSRVLPVPAADTVGAVATLTEMKPMKTKTLLLITMLLAGTLLHARTLEQGNTEAMRGVVPGNYNFWIFTPEDYEPQGRGLPLVIFLHGASLCGNDLDRVRRYGPLDAIRKGKVVPAVVLAPQNSGGAWNPRKINELLEWTETHYAIDTTRVYVLGMSLGGYGTMDFVAAYPEKIAAAMALCGGCSVKQPDGLGQVPLWILHGTADRAVSISQSKRVVSYLQQTGHDQLLRYDWLPGGSHGTPARLFYLQKTYDWLFSHSLHDTPRVVDRSFDIGMDDIRQTYQELKWFKGMFDDD